MPPQKRTKQPTDSDDLTLVQGIGKTTAARLKEAGIGSFERLARTAPSDLAALLAGKVRRSAERIAAESWTSQAAALAADSDRDRKQGGPTDNEVPRARHIFTVTLLVDVRSREVLSAKVMDGQTNDYITIAGWDVNALDAYIKERAALGDDQTTASPTAQGSPRLTQPPGTMSATAPNTASIGYPFARGTALLPLIQPDEAAEAVCIRFDPTTLSRTLPPGSYAVLEVHARRPPARMVVMGRMATDLHRLQPVDLELPIHIPAGKGPLEGRIALWVIAPGIRPNSLPATIPSIDLSVEIS
jgi:hypothetical protein